MATTNKSAAHAYDNTAEQWRARWSNPGDFFHRRTMQIANMIAAHVSSCRTLDVGCGSGMLSAMLSARGFDTYGTDISPKVLAGLPPDRFQPTDGETLPFDGDFRLITAIGVFPYVPDYAAYLEKLCTRLEPGGYIAASCTVRLSVYVAQYVSAQLRSGQFGQDARNMLRTGIQSGGYVDLKTARQCYSPRVFDRLFARAGFERIDFFPSFNMPRL